MFGAWPYFLIMNLDTVMAINYKAATLQAEKNTQQSFSIHNV